MPPEAMGAMPAVMQETGGERVSAVGLLDRGLLMVLHSGRLVPEEAWRAIQRAGGRDADEQPG